MIDRYQAEQERIADADHEVLDYVAKNGPVGLVTMEKSPPGGLSSAEARASAQRLVSRGDIVINAQFRLALPEHE